MILISIAGTGGCSNSTILKNKSLTLPLLGTTSPALVVPLEKSAVIAVKTQTIPRLALKNDTNTSTPKSDESNSELNRVGQSVFYDCIDANVGNLPVMMVRSVGDGVDVDEKQDIMKPERNDTDEESKCKAFNIIILTKNK